MVTMTSVHSDDDGEYDRVILNVLVPMPGRFELNIKWSLVPKENQSCRTLNMPNSTHPTYEHPLCFCIQAMADESTVQLLPSLTHQLSGVIGFPPKHPLAERFGVTLLAPNRFRLRIGLVHFVVHTTDDSGVYMTVEEKNALAAAAAKEAKEDAAALAAITAAPGYRGKRLSVSGREAEEGHPAHSTRLSHRKSLSRTVKKPPGGVAAEDIREACFRHGESHTLRPRAGTGSKSAVEPQLPLTDAMSDVQQKVLDAMGQRTQDANVGPVAVAVVVGNWKRVEWLKPQPRAPGSERSGAEVQEAVMRFGDDDQNQAVSIVVFVRRHDELELRVPSRFLLAEFLVHNTEKYAFDENLDYSSQGWDS